MSVARRLVAAVVAGAGRGVVAWWATAAARPPMRATLLAERRSRCSAGNYQRRRGPCARRGRCAEPSAGTAHVAARARRAANSATGWRPTPRSSARVAVGLPAPRLHQLVARRRGCSRAIPPVRSTRPARRRRAYAAYARRIRARALAAQGDIRRAAQRAAGSAASRRAPRDARGVGRPGGRSASRRAISAARPPRRARAVALRPREPAALTLTGELVRSRYGLRRRAPLVRGGADARRPLPSGADRICRDARRCSGATPTCSPRTRRALAARPGQPAGASTSRRCSPRARGQARSRRGAAPATGGGVDGMPGALLLGGALDYAGGRYAAGRRQLARAGRRHSR